MSVDFQRAKRPRLPDGCMLPFSSPLAVTAAVFSPCLSAVLNSAPALSNIGFKKVGIGGPRPSRGVFFVEYWVDRGLTNLTAAIRKLHHVSVFRSEPLSPTKSSAYRVSCQAHKYVQAHDTWVWTTDGDFQTRQRAMCIDFFLQQSVGDVQAPESPASHHIFVDSISNWTGLWVTLLHGVMHVRILLIPPSWNPARRNFPKPAAM